MFSHVSFAQVCCHFKAEIAHYTDSSSCCSDRLPNYYKRLTHSAGFLALSWAPEVAASPAKVLLLKRVRVRFLSTGARGAAHSFVVRVDAQSSLDHDHALVVLVTARRVCKGKRENYVSQGWKKGRRKSDFKQNLSFFDETMDLLISARHGCLLHSSRLSGFKLGSQSSLGVTLSVRQRTSRTR